METITDNILKSLIDDIMNMKTANLIRCINKYACWTYFNNIDDEVCKLNDVLYVRTGYRDIQQFKECD